MDARTDLSIEHVFGDLPTLETERTLLRKVRREDADDLYAYGSDPEVTRFTSWDTYSSINDAHAFIDLLLARYREGRPSDWGIEHRADRRLIGTVGFLWWEPHEAAAEIGYGLARPYWGQGIMTEVAREVLRFGFDVMGLNRIEAQCEAANAGSYRVMEKCGMTYEGTLRERVFNGERFIDLRVYSILRREYP